MNLLKAGGTIGGLTLVSRILGFAREMVFARVMGASAAAEVFIWAFQLPNLLRRLLGEGAFSQGFVPLFARRIGKDGDLTDAKQFAEEVQAVFLPALVLITAVFVVAMPAVVIAVASDRWTGDPDKFAFTVFLTRITFPYLIFISMVSLFSGILNSLSRFVAAALAMGVTIWLVGQFLGNLFSGSVGQRLIGTVALIGAGGIVYFALAWITGGMDREDLLVLLRRKKVEE